VTQPTEHTESNRETFGNKSREPVPPYALDDQEPKAGVAQDQQHSKTASDTTITPNKQNNSFMVLMWVLALIISVRAFYVLFNTYFSAETAIQQAAGAAFAAGMAVIPYCIVRAISEIMRLKS
jgi:prolipoprotein diacylglyceryltransferase